MPNLDVSDIVADPDFAEFLTVNRIAVANGTNGRPSRTVTTISPAPVGVVTPKSGEKLERSADAQFRPNVIVVHTQFRLRSAAPGYDPDQVIWNGDPYVVTSVDNLSHFGAGFIVAECSSIDSIDQAPQ
jgi:hypothetical protein